ncbi:MAG: PAS domain S-box protein, partial [Desulfobacteraceae bacterium]|nr:PAS domain S-box protein [Desulfobacteraceae bacterium]
YDQKNQYYRQIHLITLEGRSILSVSRSQKPKPAEFSQTRWFSAAIEQDSFLSDIVLDPGTGSSSIIFAKKVYDFEDKKKPVGILAFEINPETFTAFVSSMKIGAQGYSFLLDDKGFLIYHPDQELILKNTFVKSGDARMEQLIQQMQKQERGFGKYRFKGRIKYMAFTPCRIKPWSVGITLQRAEFMTDIMNLRQSIMTFSTLLIALIIAVSILFVKSLTQPISQLINGARAIGAGDLDQTIKVASSDEFQHLAMEFNNMALKLKTSVQELVELKTFSDDIFRSVTSGIITVDRKGAVTSFNRSAENLFSCTKEVIDNENLSKVPQRIGKILDLLAQTLEKEEKIEHEVIDFINRRKEPVFMEVNTSLLNDSNGYVIGAIADIRDITLRKRMEELMVRVDKLASLGELSAGIAHEIRNPLAGMKTSIQVLEKKLSDSSQKVLTQGVLSEINRLNDIVTGLLHFSRPSPTFPDTVDIKAVLQKTLDLVMEKIKTQGIEIKTEYATSLVPAFVDKEQMQQVFLNLVLNAVNAMTEQGILTITARMVSNHDQQQDKIQKRIAQPFDSTAVLENEMMELSFKDTGKGIPKEDLPKVFNPFFTTDPNGTGLGLSIAHKLLEKNNGYIYIDSSEDQGCLVTVIIPVAQKGLPDHNNGLDEA